MVARRVREGLRRKQTSHHVFQAIRSIGVPQRRRERVTVRSLGRGSVSGPVGQGVQQGNEEPPRDRVPTQSG